MTSRAIQQDPAFLPHSPQQVKQAFIAAGKSFGDSGARREDDVGA